MNFIPEKDKEYLWWRDGVIYHIYLPSFLDTNADGIGDIKGISDKLDYLSGLGVDGLWLTAAPLPAAEDAQCDHTKKEYQELCEAAHKRGLHVFSDNLTTADNEEKPQGIFNAEFSSCKWDARAYRKLIRNWQVTYSEKNWPSHTLSDSEGKRMASRVGLGEFDGRLKAAAALTLLLRGTPVLYYGEEIGMRDIRLPRASHKDPEANGSRAPMQWNDQTNAGFTSTEPWLPLNRDYKTRNVNAMLHDPDSLFSFYKDLISLRKRLISLRKGSLRLLDEKNETVLSFIREYGRETTLICLNFSQMPGLARLTEADAKLNWQVKLSTKPEKMPTVKDGQVLLSGEQVVVYGAAKH